MDHMPDHLKQEVLVRVSVQNLYKVRQAIPEWTYLIDPIIKVKTPIEERRDLLTDARFFMYIKGMSVADAHARLMANAYSMRLALRFNQILHRLIQCQVAAGKLTGEDVDTDDWTDDTLKVMQDEVLEELAPECILRELKKVEGFFLDGLPSFMNSA